MPPKRTTPVPCSTCGAAVLHLSKGLCKPCYDRQRRTILHDAIAAQKRAHYLANRERLNAQSRARHWANRARYLAAKRAYWAAHATEINARRRDLSDDQRRERAALARMRRAANRDAINARIRAWGPERRARHVAHSREYARQHPEVVRARGQRYKVRKRLAMVERVSLAEIWERDHGICQICMKPVTKATASLDHILPLAVGGDHSRRNLRLTHIACNVQRKHRGHAQLRLFG